MSQAPQKKTNPSTKKASGHDKSSLTFSPRNIDCRFEIRPSDLCFSALVMRKISGWQTISWPGPHQVKTHLFQYDGCKNGNLPKQLYFGLWGILHLSKATTPTQCHEAELYCIRIEHFHFQKKTTMISDSISWSFLPIKGGHWDPWEFSLPPLPQKLLVTASGDLVPSFTCLRLSWRSYAFCIQAL